MPINRFNHVDLRVTSMAQATPFYEALLPALGFTRTRHEPEWKVFSMEGAFPSAPFFAFTEEPDHRPNATRIAFWTENPREVDRLADIARKAGARNISGPRPCPEYSPTYYAVFFEDSCGNKLEICYREN